MKIKNSSSKVPIVSLFCGAGGLDLGFSQAGFETIFAADHMASAVSTFNKNIENVAVEINLLEISSKDVVDLIQEKARATNTHPRGLIGGPPCQGVSAANNGSGPEDPRNILFDRYVAILREANKRFSLDFFVLENVPGLHAEKNRGIHQKLTKALGKDFIISEQILNAAHYGVPQTRRRLIIVGLSKRKDSFKFTFPCATSELTPLCVRDVLQGLPAPVYFQRGSGIRGGTAHPNHWTMAPVSQKFVDGVKSSSGRSFIKLDWDKPSRTVAYGNREIHIHPEGKRRLSIFEAMLLQGFPSTFQILGTLSDQVTQVSNAVPPPLARAIADSLNIAIRE